LATFLYHGLHERHVPVTCICARHAKLALKTRNNKTDRADAEGLAQLARVGWFKPVHMKASGTHIDRAALKIRAQLISAKNAMVNQMRGMLKLFGLRIGKATTPGKRRERLEALFAQRGELRALFAPLLVVIETLEAQIGLASKGLEARAAADPVCARLMTVPGIGPVTSLIYTSTIEDPGRFARSSDVGAYAGLVPQRIQSGERDVRIGISGKGDAMLRSALFEAANNLLCRVKRPCAIRQWGLNLVKTKGPKSAKAAVARKLAELLHRLWLNESEFCWG
jgi:transposase